MYIFHFCIFIYITCSISFLAGGEKETLYALLAIDTLSEDVQKSTILDAKIMFSLLHNLPSRICVKSTTLYGTQLSRENIDAWIQSIPEEGKKRIFFYYSGHGIRDIESLSPWPILCLEKDLIPSSLIQSAIRQKSPELFIFMTDCCNHFVEASGDMIQILRSLDTNSPITLSKKRESKRVIKNISSLFLLPKGEILITASKPGMPAGAIESGGSLMTHFFYKTIRCHKVKKKRLVWQKAIQNVIKSTESFYQTPYYQIHF